MARSDPRKPGIEGLRFGRLVVIRREAVLPLGKARWVCLCDCGAEATITKGNLVTGIAKSCGCLRREKTGEKFHKHGSPDGYKSWQGAVFRCENKKFPAYPRYGGRGISICSRWRWGEAGLSGFECFLMDMGPRPSKELSLDRIDNDGNYEPTNCRWATKAQQTENRSISKKYQNKTSNQPGL